MVGAILLKYQLGAAVTPFPIEALVSFGTGQPLAEHRYQPDVDGASASHKTGPTYASPVGRTPKPYWSDI